MDIKQVTEKILEFCRRSYPNLRWNLDSKNNTIQCPDSPHKLWIDVFLYGQLYRVSCEVYCVGGFELWINSNDRDNNCLYNNQIVFHHIDHIRSESDYFDNKYRETRKVMVDIFNFILDEIQE